MRDTARLSRRSARRSNKLVERLHKLLGTDEKDVCDFGLVIAAAASCAATLALRAPSH
jgi:hypothetical protein